MTVYHTVVEAMAALANKKYYWQWVIKRNDNGWYYLAKKREVKT